MTPFELWSSFIRSEGRVAIGQKTPAHRLENQKVKINEPILPFFVGGGDFIFLTHRFLHGRQCWCLFEDWSDRLSWVLSVASPREFMPFFFFMLYRTAGELDFFFCFYAEGGHRGTELSSCMYPCGNLLAVWWSWPNVKCQNERAWVQYGRR